MRGPIAQDILGVSSTNLNTSDLARPVTAVVASEGGARLHRSYLADISRFFSMPVCTGAPVEEALRTCGSICMDRLLWQAVDKLAASNFAKNMDMILMGRSFGVTVARFLSLRMDAIGFPARGLTALECR